MTDSADPLDAFEPLLGVMSMRTTWADIDAAVEVDGNTVVFS